MAKATKKQVLGRGLSALLKDPSNDEIARNFMGFIKSHDFNKFSYHYDLYMIS